MKKQIKFTPPESHPESYGSLQVVRSLKDRLFILLPQGHYICVELLETGRTRGLMQVTTHRSIPILREEIFKRNSKLQVNDWEPVDSDPSKVEDNYDNFRD